MGRGGESKRKMRREYKSIKEKVNTAGEGALEKGGLWG